MSSKYRKVPWKRNLNKVPRNVVDELTENPNRDYVAGVVVSIPRHEMEAGVYKHLGIEVAGGALVFKEQVLPRANMGKYSTRNRDGWEVKRDDLPMVTRTYDIEVLNFGDWGNGSHTISVDRDVYQRDYYEPLDISIAVRKIKAGTDGSSIFKFVVEMPLDPDAPDFDDDLLFALNLLQENAGSAGLLERGADDASLVATLDLEWEVFPPGTIEETAIRMRMRGRRSDEAEMVIRDRLKLFNSLKPNRYLRGRGGLNHYIGAQFADDLVVFENLRHGNAVYVLYGDWQEVSKRSRIELLRSGTAQFDRFVHTDGWQERLKAHITREKKVRGISDDPDFDFEAA